MGKPPGPFAEHVRQNYPLNLVSRGSSYESSLNIVPRIFRPTRTTIYGNTLAATRDDPYDIQVTRASR